MDPDLNNNTRDPSHLPPLVINADQPVVGAPKARGSSWREALNHYGGVALRAPWRTRQRRIVSGSLVLTAVIVAGVAAYLLTRPVPQPDYETAGMDTIFNYTLLTSEFNDLPIKERLELIALLVQRMKNMDSSDALLLASFSSGIAGAAREQLMENASRLMIDTADMFASEYAFVVPQDRNAFLDDAFIRLTELAETFEGRPSEKTREEKLARARKDATRDQKRMRENRMSQRQAGRLFRFVDGDIGQHATPQQKGRISVLFRDMTRNLRGEDIATGKPKSPGGG